MGRPVSRFGKGSMSPRTVLAVAIMILIGVAATVYISMRGNSGSGGHPTPPLVSAELTDPAARKVIEEYRRRVVANPTSSTAWGELAMAFDAHFETTSAAECYRQAMRLDAKD